MSKRARQTSQQIYPHKRFKDDNDDNKEYRSLLSELAKLNIDDKNGGNDQDETCPICSVELSLKQFADHVYQCLDGMDATNRQHIIITDQDDHEDDDGDDDGDDDIKKVKAMSRDQMIECASKLITLQQESKQFDNMLKMFGYLHFNKENVKSVLKKEAMHKENDNDGDEKREIFESEQENKLNQEYEINNLKKKNKKLSEDKKTLKGYNKEYKKQNKNYVEQIKSFENELKKQKQENAKNIKEYKKMKQFEDKYNELNKSNQDELNKKANEYETKYNEKLEEMKKQNEEYKMKMNNLEKQNTELIEEKNKLIEKDKSNKTELEKEKKENQKLIQNAEKIEKELNDLKQQNKGLIVYETKYNEQKKENQQLTETINQENQKTIENNDKIRSLTDQHTKLQSNIECVKNEKKQLTEKINKQNQDKLEQYKSSETEQKKKYKQLLNDKNESDKSNKIELEKYKQIEKKLNAKINESQNENEQLLHKINEKETDHKALTEKLNDEIVTLTEKINNEKKENEELLNEKKDEYDIKIQSLTDQHTELNKSNQDLLKEKNELTVSLERYKTENEEYKMKMNNLEKQNEELIAENQGNKQLLIKHEQKNNELEKERIKYRDSEKSKNEMQNELNNLNDKINELTEKINEEKKENEELRQNTDQHTELQSNIECVENEKKQLTEKINEQNQALKEVKDKLQQYKSSETEQKKKYKELSSKYDELQSKNKQLLDDKSNKIELEKYKQIEKKLNDKINESQNELQKQTQQKQTVITEKLNKYNDEIVMLTEKIKQLNEKNELTEKLNKEKKEKEELIENTENTEEYKELLSKYNEINKEKEKYKQKIQSLTDENETLLVKYEQINKDKNELSKQMEENRKQNDDINRKIIALTKQNQDKLEQYQDKLEQYKSKNKQLLNDKNESDKSNKIELEKYKQIEKKLNDKIQRLNNLNDKINGLTEEKKENEELIQKLTKQNEVLTDEKDKLKQSLNDKNQLIQDLEDDKSSQHTELQSNIECVTNDNKKLLNDKKLLNEKINLNESENEMKIQDKDKIIVKLKRDLSVAQKTIIETTSVVGVQQSLPTIQETIQRFGRIRDQKHQETSTLLKQFIQKNCNHKWQKYYINQIVHKIMFEILIKCYKNIEIYKQQIYDNIADQLNMKHVIADDYKIDRNQIDNNSENMKIIKKKQTSLLSNMFGGYFKNHFEYVLQKKDEKQLLDDILYWIKNNYSRYLGDDELNGLKEYIIECNEICWIMILQNPPLHIQPSKWLPSVHDDKKYDEEYQKKASISDTNCTKILYYVWPAVAQNGVIWGEQKIEVLLRNELYTEFEPKPDPERSDKIIASKDVTDKLERYKSSETEQKKNNKEENNQLLTETEKAETKISKQQMYIGIGVIFVFFLFILSAFFGNGAKTLQQKEARTVEITSFDYADLLNSTSLSQSLQQIQSGNNNRLMIVAFDDSLNGQESSGNVYKVRLFQKIDGIAKQIPKHKLFKQYQADDIPHFVLFDCGSSEDDAAKNVCKQLVGSNIPNLLIFRSFSQPRTLPFHLRLDDHIITYLYDLMQPAVQCFDEVIDAENFVADDSELHCLLFSNDTDNDAIRVYDKVSDSLRDYGYFGHTQNPLVIESFGLDESQLPTLLIWRTFGENPQTFNGNVTSRESVTDFIMNNYVPIFGEFNQMTSKRFMNRGLPILWIAYNNKMHDDALNVLLNSALSVAKRYRGQLTFVQLNVDAQPQIAQNFGLQIKDKTDDDDEDENDNLNLPQVFIINQIAEIKKIVNMEDIEGTIQKVIDAYFLQFETQLNDDDDNIFEEDEEIKTGEEERSETNL